MVERSVLAALMAVIAERKARPPAERSYVVSLLQGGDAKIGAKLEEEAAEVVAAAGEPGPEGRSHLIQAEVEAELGRRFGTSGIVEKQSRPPRPS
jgi:phosphoribosyl-ATP pyrophosphohydrolase